MTTSIPIIHTPEKADGGPAFPHMMARGHQDYSGGMSLRDYFAGQALTTVQSKGWARSDLAAHCYLIADAMLRERER